jgi:hypothetical protein
MTPNDPITLSVYRFILRTFAQTGKSPSPSAIAAGLNLPDPAEVDAHLQSLEAQGSLYRHPVTGDILAAYPFSAAPTSCRVVWGGDKEVYAMCAIDALGIPYLLDADAAIESTCAQCGKVITVAIAEGRVISASEGLVVLYTDPRSECCAATEQCPNINFFCSPDHARAWQADHPRIGMRIMTLSEAVAHGKTEFGDLLRENA